MDLFLDLYLDLYLEMEILDSFYNWIFLLDLSLFSIAVKYPWFPTLHNFAYHGKKPQFKIINFLADKGGYLYLYYKISKS